MDNSEEMEDSSDSYKDIIITYDAPAGGVYKQNRKILHLEEGTMESIRNSEYGKCIFENSKIGLQTKFMKR